MCRFLFHCLGGMDMKKYSKDTIKWCSHQRRGIKLVNPNVETCRSHIIKANRALKSMNLNYKEGLTEWAVEAAYYARYHCLYALLLRCGIKSEIHDCTIAVAKIVFSDLVSEKVINELSIAKQQREDTQYYSDRVVDEKACETNINSAPEFVLTLEEKIESLNDEKVETYRKKIKSLLA